jgi:hypothetical protein
MKTQINIDEIYEETLKTCERSMSDFRQKNSMLIGELLQANRYNDLLQIIYKEGFLQGMKHNRQMRDGIISKF